MLNTGCVRNGDVRASPVGIRRELAIAASVPIGRDAAAPPAPAANAATIAAMSAASVVSSSATLIVPSAR